MWNGNCERLQMNSSKVHVSKLENLLIAAASLYSLSKIYLHFPRYVCNIIHHPEQITHVKISTYDTDVVKSTKYSNLLNELPMHYISGGERNLGQGQGKKSEPIWSDNFLTVSLLTIIVWWNPSKKVQVHHHVVRTRKFTVRPFLNIQNDSGIQNTLARSYSLRRMVRLNEVVRRCIR